MIILDGKSLALKMENKIKQKIAKLKTQLKLVVILVGNNPASQIYVKKKEEACKRVGIKSKIYKLPKNVKEKNFLQLIKKLNLDKKVNGILIQLPLPKHINTNKVLESVSPKKDVDCFHPENIGKLLINKPKFKPCTPNGILKLLSYYKISIQGKLCVVVGQSNIVGKPMSILFLNNKGTVISCHDKTKNLKQLTKQADILVSAVGKKNFIKANMIKKGVVLLDVGINKKNNKIYGDIDFKECSKKAKAISPVPGGIGPMTVFSLLENTLKTHY